MLEVSKVRQATKNVLANSNFKNDNDNFSLSDSFDVIIDIKNIFLEFQLLWSWVAPYLQFIATNCLITS